MFIRQNPKIILSACSLAYFNNAPPLVLITLPVTLWPFIKKRYASATSSTFPIIPIHVPLPSRSCSFSLCSSLMPSHNGVATPPGLTAFTLIGAKSRASPLAMPCTPVANEFTTAHPASGRSDTEPVVSVIDDAGPGVRGLVVYFATSSGAKNLTMPAFSIN